MSLDDGDVYHPAHGVYGGGNGSNSPLAGPGRRLLGYLVDGIVLTIATFLVTVPHLGMRGSSGGSRLTVTVLAAAYDVIGVAVWGRTVGKVVVGTRVVSEWTGGIPTWGSAVLRWMVPAAPGLVGLLIGSGADGSAALALAAAVYPVIVYGPVLWNDRRRGLHDKMAGTVVVLVSPAGGARRGHLG